MHRNRRDIIGHIERVATEYAKKKKKVQFTLMDFKMIHSNGLDIRSCLLRVICEANHYLLPQGQSFFQDVLRILFT